MKLIDRFLNYVRQDTQSDEKTGVTPSTEKQMRFAEMLREELLDLGLKEVELNNDGYLFATLPATTEQEVPVIGFIAHMDTSPDMTGANVNPRIVSNYGGGDIALDPEGEFVLSPAQFPELLRHKGQDLVVTDGQTLLGADDKAGIAEIVDAMGYLLAHPEIKHGKIRIAFTPDEEIGLGAHKFDVEKFGAAWAYTLDGGEVGELEYENFNAASAKIKIRGRNVHPGSAKGKMINSLHIAHELVGMLPPREVPEQTEGYEGFYHLIGMDGGVEETRVRYILREHDRVLFERRKEYLKECVRELNAKYGAGTVALEMSDQYYNMREKILPKMHLVEIAAEAMKQVGIEPLVKPIRGGTDGAQLSYKGLPCPNLFAGGLNFHGRYEYVPVQSMELASRVIVKIAELTVKLASGRKNR